VDEVWQSIVRQQFGAAIDMLDNAIVACEKCRLRIDSVTDEQTNQWCDYGCMKVSVGEALLYNMRHVQHHAGQLNLLLRQRINMAPKWVARSFMA
jgi:uncharacterized damage-inducible protein DinB